MSSQIEGLRVSEHLDLAKFVHGQLEPPDRFDTKKFALCWRKWGASADKARQTERLNAKYAADGWKVWKDPQTGRSCMRPLSDGKYVCMFRPKSLQEAVNAVYGNNSREHLLNEHEGKTQEGGPVKEGMLTDEYLSQFPQYASERQERLRMGFNSVPLPSDRLDVNATSNTSTKRKRT